MSAPRISDALYRVAVDAQENALREAGTRGLPMDAVAVAVATAVLDHVSDELERSGQTRAALYVQRMTVG